MAFNQSDRLLRIYEGPFTDGAFQLTSISGQEAMSRLYSYQIEFVSTKLDLNAATVIGQPVKIEIASDEKGGDIRYVHGYISRLSAGEVGLIKGQGGSTDYREYRAEVVPWLWFLTQTARCFIYFPEKKEKKVADIIEAVLKRAKAEFELVAEFEIAGLSKLDRMVEHCVQYRETDFNFVSRIMEQYGVYFYFKQEKGGHKMVLGMDKNYPPASPAAVRFSDKSVAGSNSEHQINSWEHAYEFVSGKWTHTDYNFETSSEKLLTKSDKITTKHSIAEKFEVYDFPGEYAKVAEGNVDARVRQEEEEVPHNSVNASSRCRGFQVGHTFELLKGKKDKSLETEAGNYLITSIHHYANQPGPETGGSSGGASYSNSFSCVPFDVQFRPARVTPKPVVSGIQTAVVVGKKGQEIETDEFGRIKICFHWDREDYYPPQAKHDKLENGEMFYCWVRVAQNIAGKGWGFMAIPRIGQEVVVDFIEGDPDRPLVVGSVYNDKQMPAYDLDQHKTRTYIKTNSSPGGVGYNEFRFEDLKGEEQIFVHAERNMDVRVKNDSMELIYGNRHQIIGWEDKEGEKGGDQKEEIKKDKHIKVHNDHSEQVGGNMKLLVGGIDGDGNQDVVIKKDKKLLVDGDRHTHVKGEDLISIDKDRHVNVGGDHVLEIGGSSAHVATADHLMKGVNISIEGTAICLKSGGNSITIDPSGVTIVGTLVRVNSGPGAPVVPQAAMLSCKAPQDAEEAAPVEPAKADNSKTGDKSAPG